MKPVCKIRIPPATDKATAARTEAKALMRGLLEEMGVPDLVAKGEAQEAELQRMRRANGYLARRLESVGAGSSPVYDLVEALLEYLSLVGGDGEEVGADAGLARAYPLTEEQSRGFVARLLSIPILSGSAPRATLEAHEEVPGVDSASRLRREPGVAPPEGEADEDLIGDLEM